MRNAGCDKNARGATRAVATRSVFKVSRIYHKKIKLLSQKALKEYKNQEFESFKNFQKYKKAMRA